MNLPLYLFPENMQLEKKETLKIQKMKILGTHFFPNGYILHIEICLNYFIALLRDDTQ